MFTNKRYRMILALIIPISFIFSTTTTRSIDSISFVNSTPSPTSTPTLSNTPTLTPSPTATLTPTKTPTPTPNPTEAPTPIPVSKSDYDNWFSKYSNHYGIDRNTLYLIAVCESKLNPNATNGDYKGLFQFSSGTWQTTRRTMGIDQNPDLRLNPEESIKTAAYKIANGGNGAWKNCLP